MTDQPQNNDDWLPALDEAPAPTEEDLRQALREAPEVVPIDEGKPGKPDSPAPASGGGGRRSSGRPVGEIFEDCPVTPLGVRGDFCFYLDVLGQLRAVKKHEAQTIQSLFGHMIPRLCHNFPQWGEKDGVPYKKPGKFEHNAASMAMYMAASERGVFNQDNTVRGVGAWTDDDGNLVYHMGDAVLIGGEMQKPGRIGKHIYPAYPAIPRPNDTDGAPDPAPDILRTLETWQWTQPDVHPFIALGMIATQMLCGALDWRPVFWLLGPAAAGKSSFQDLVDLLHGDGGQVKTTDTTKSGITSKLGQSSLPVSIDELEPGDERSTKERDIIALARVAASGGEWFRGSADQTGVGGKVYSAFLFSSILIPGIMKTQDVQRLIRLELRAFERGSKAPKMDRRTWRARGARLKQLLIARWPSWSERLAIWRHELEVAGVTGRDADNWGTVLAMADMGSNEDLPDAAVTSSWARKIAFVANADREETTNDAEAMLLHLMAQPFDIYRRGELHTVAQWVMAAAGLPGAPHDLVDGDQGLLEHERRSRHNSKLAKAGLRVNGKGEDAHLFIANQCIHGLNELFRGSQWHGGVWKQSAARIPGAEPTPNPLTLAGIRSRGYQVPIASIPGLTAFPMDRSGDDGSQRRDGDASDIDHWR